MEETKNEEEVGDEGNINYGAREKSWRRKDI